MNVKLLTKEPPISLEKGMILYDSDIGEQYIITGISWSSIGTILHLDISVKRHKSHDDQVITEYKKGLSIKQISKNLKMKTESIERIIRGRVK